MNESLTGATPKRPGVYRTAAILALVALGLFVFTLYNGLK